MSYYIGVDIGGTNLKAGIVTETGEIVSESTMPTGAHRPQEIVMRDIVKVVELSIKSREISRSDIQGIGIGSPGIIKDGTVLYNCNLGWRNFAIASQMRDAFGLPVRLENDADCAALGEVIAGSAKGASSAMIITLGTGIGAGFVVNGKIYPGSEFGHMVIVYDGLECTCGRKGCFEVYASATGLIRQTKEAVALNPVSELARQVQRDGEVTGQTAFNGDDDISRQVVDEYISYLSCGLVNIINGLHPEVISIGGGIGQQGERLLAPLRRKVCREVYGEQETGESYTRIVSCTLGYKAGLIGAAMSSRDMEGSPLR